jgi:anti-anti-sigma factor
MLDLNSEYDDDVLVLNPSGRIDGATAKEYEEALLDRIANGHSKILMNCEAIEYISSAGLRVLLMTSRRAGEAAGKLVLCAVKDHVHDVFKHSGFAEIIPIHGDQDEAREAF